MTTTSVTRARTGKWRPTSASTAPSSACGQYAAQAIDVGFGQVGVVDEGGDERDVRRHPVGAVGRELPAAPVHDRRDGAERHDDRGGRHRCPV